MTPDEVIPDWFRGELSMKKKGRQIFSQQGFHANGASGNDCQGGGCCEKFKWLVCTFHHISLVWLIRFVKNYRRIKSTQNFLSNGEIPTILTLIVKKWWLNIVKPPPEEILKIVSNYQLLVRTFTNDRPGIQATCYIIYRYAGVIFVDVGRFLMLLGCCY